VRLSRTRSSIILCAGLLFHTAHGMCQNERHAKHANRAPKESLQRGKDDVIRDFVQMLYPSWSDLSLDLLISGKRSMDPYYGVTWNFTVVPTSQLIFYGFSPSSTPCGNLQDCFPNLIIRLLYWSTGCPSEDRESMPTKDHALR
jgi:hypothetical protein